MSRLTKRNSSYSLENTANNIFNTLWDFGLPKPMELTTTWPNTTSWIQVGPIPEKLEKGQAKISIDITVSGKTKREQNLLLAEELRKAADALEAEEVEEEQIEDTEPVVNVNVERG